MRQMLLRKVQFFTFSEMKYDAINVALETFSPAYPLSAKTRWMNGKMYREIRRSGAPPSER